MHFVLTENFQFFCISEHIKGQVHLTNSVVTI
jgi:hypothetical protein